MYIQRAYRVHKTCLRCILTQYWSVEVCILVQIVNSLNGSRVTALSPIYLEVMSTAGRISTMITVPPITSTVCTDGKSQTTALIDFIVVGYGLQLQYKINSQQEKFCRYKLHVGLAVLYILIWYISVLLKAIPGIISTLP